MQITFFLTITHKCFVQGATLHSRFPEAELYSIDAYLQPWVDLGLCAENTETGERLPHSPGCVILLFSFKCNKGHM